MAVRNIFILYLSICVQRIRCQAPMQDFAVCHDDFNLKLVNGILKDHAFSWLGYVQYVHVVTGHLHESKAPRVVLVQQQFVLGTAVDLMLIPKTYKLGNVIFGYYEQEEIECGLKVADIKSGAKCPRAYLEIPVINVKPHPEFLRFGSENSLALAKLLRPMKSAYMVPVCLPTLSQRTRLRKLKMVHLVDYISTVPADLESERMAIKSLKLYTHRDCVRHKSRADLSTEGISQLLCTSGCGVRPGAPIITHAASGRVELVGLATGGEPCIENFMRSRLNEDPPMYVDVFPFVSWIMNVVTAHHIPKAYPHSFQLVEGKAYMGPKKQSLRSRVGNKEQKTGWNGRTFLCGNYCYLDFRIQASTTAFFYSENFEVNLTPPVNLDVIVKIFAGESCDVVCARIILPNRLSKPTITGIGTSNITVSFDANYCPYQFFFTLLLTGTNSSLSGY